MNIIIEILGNAYDNDAIRFGLWGWFENIGIADEIATIIRTFGWTLFEDFSIGK